jgi:hypothetical protein
MSQHAGLTLERWRTFDRHQQILMVANEMYRGRRLLEPAALERCYERVLRLVDLTVQCDHGLPFRRELLRWRDGVALLYLSARAATDGHNAMTPADHSTRARVDWSYGAPNHAQLLGTLLLSSTEAARQRSALAADL